MKIAILACRVLLGFVFFFFGLNHILHFLHPPVPAGDAGIFVTILQTHKFMAFVGVLQIVGGLLLMVGRYVPLGLTLLAPIIVNILLYHVLLDPSGLAIGLVCAIIEVFLIFAYRLSFQGLFDAAPEVS